MAIITINIQKDASDELARISAREIPFVVAKSLTNIAQHSQKKVRQHIREEFHIRKRSRGFESSIRIKPATKRNLSAEIYTMASFAALHQTGGAKRSKDGRLAIPVYDNIAEVKRRSKRNNPASYLAGDAFVMKARSGKEFIARRGKNKKLKILYFLKKEAEIDKRFEMVEMTKKTVENEFGMVFRRNVRELLNKAR